MADDYLPVLVSVADLAPFATIPAGKAHAMIEHATAQAVTVAPCLAGDLTYVQQVAVRSVLVAAILRWDETGTGAKTTSQVAAGPFQQSETIDNTQQRRGVFWPSEIRSLQAVCKKSPAPFMLDLGGGGTMHTPTCALTLGALYCDCGADLGMDPES